MNFNNVFLKSFRVLLLPFALIYGWIVFVRNWMYAKQYLKSTSFNVPLNCIGNLSMGGTGKSPMVEHLLSILSEEYKIATLSRGYKRKTKGYALANEASTALEIGDEPMQFHLKFPNVAVSVGERRIEAMAQLIQDVPKVEAIILDDAFQHLEIKAGFNILLTEYDNLFCDDFFIPTGDLRDDRKSAERADIIIVTKCPANLSLEEKEEITEIKQKKNYTLYSFDVYIKIPISKIKQHFTYAYCRTGHSIQGITIDTAITIYDHNYYYTSREWLWTAITRATDFKQVYFYNGKSQEFNRERLLSYFRNKITGYVDQDTKAKRKYDKTKYITVEWLEDAFSKTCYRCSCVFDAHISQSVRCNLTADRHI